MAAKHKPVADHPWSRRFKRDPVPHWPGESRGQFLRRQWRDQKARGER